MEPHVSLVTLGVSNLERAVAFYRDGPGLLVREDDSGVTPSNQVGFNSCSPLYAQAEDAGV